MEIKDKYISEHDNNVKPDHKKVIISDEAYALIEIIQDLISRMGVKK